MNNQLIIQICKNAAEILTDMDGETANAPKKGRHPLIFPEKIQDDGKKHINRISEQELRLMFIQELELADSSISYSIETPTSNKYKLGKKIEDFKINMGKCESALTDLTIFELDASEYKRKYNIEFKHSVRKVPVAKDLFKLINEPEDGALIVLIDKLNTGTFCNTNSNRKGHFNKIHEALTELADYWVDENKTILFAFISLPNKLIIHKTMNQSDLNIDLDEIFMNPDKTPMDKIPGWTQIPF